MFSIISEIIEISIEEKKNDAQDTSVEAVFLSILRQHNLDIRDKKAAIVDFIAAGIHTVRISPHTAPCNKNTRIVLCREKKEKRI